MEQIFRMIGRTSRPASQQPTSQQHNRALAVGSGLVGAALLAASAHVRLPFWPVPMTMQSFVVLLLGVAYGPRLAAASTLAYLAMGAIGLPVFAGSPGLLGPTGGYLAGFLVAATLAGFTFERWPPRSAAAAFVLLLAADAALFACGFAWLASLIGPTRALAVGVIPFLPAEIFKLMLATALSRTRLLRLPD